MSSKWKRSSCEASLSCMRLNLPTARWQCVSHTMEWGWGSTYTWVLNFECYFTLKVSVLTYIQIALWLVHTADADETKLSCLVCSCVHNANSTRQNSFVTSPDADSSKLGRDEIKLSCWRCERNWRPDKTCFVASAVWTSHYMREYTVICFCLSLGARFSLPMYSNIIGTVWTCAVFCPDLMCYRLHYYYFNVS